MRPILFECQNNILKQLLSLFRSPCIIALKNRDTVLLFIWQYVIVQHPSTVNFHLVYTSSAANIPGTFCRIYATSFSILVLPQVDSAVLNFSCPVLPSFMTYSGFSLINLADSREKPFLCNRIVSGFVVPYSTYSYQLFLSRAASPLISRYSFENLRK